jgi:DHA2 family multidrug resistance protein
MGLGLVALGLGALQMILDKGQEEDWFGSPLIVWLTVVTLVALVGFVVWELQVPDPVVDLRLFRNRNFAMAVALMFALGVVLFGTTVLIPQFLQLFLGYTAEQAGMALSPGGLVILCLMPIVGVLVSRVEARWLIAMGFAILSAALWHMTNINLLIDFRTAVFWRIYQAMGMAFIFIPINTVSYIGVPQTKNNDVSGMMNLARNIGGSVGIAFLTTFIARQSQRHQTFLIEHVTPFSQTYRSTLQGLANSLTAGGISAADSLEIARARLYEEVQRQAAVLSYVDLLSWMAVAAACITPLVFLLRRNVPGRAPVGAH